ncbi:hypothetical protein B4Q13_24425 [Lacticaseibacillus rhamnosus]
MPDAGRTREALRAKGNAHCARKQRQVQPNSGIPCAMVLTAYARALLGVPGLLAPVASQIVRET